MDRARQFTQTRFVESMRAALDLPSVPV